MKKRRIVEGIIVLILITAIAVVALSAFNLSRIPHMFRLNKQLQEEGYYMAEFEFKMLGIAYYLDKGHYAQAIGGLGNLYHQMKTKKNLIKVPQFTDKRQEMEFYVNLQNPETGAFMDSSYPYCTFNEPTENILLHLDALSRETGQPVRLKYPLKYLDKIKSPQDLTAFLDDVSNVGWIASKLPQTTFVFARSLLSYGNGEGVIKKHNLYRFSPEWERALIQWFSDNQDPQTGFWGPRSRRTRKLLTKDLTNTASIIKAFVDEGGGDRDPSVPLRYRNEIFATTLSVMSGAMPAEDDIDEIHEWNLVMGKGMRMLMRFLWRDATPQQVESAKALIENYIKIEFEKCYIASEGAFSYYPGSEHATLDGTGGMVNLFEAVGAFSGKTQDYLWSKTKYHDEEQRIRLVTNVGESEAGAFMKNDQVNSIRIFATAPVSGDYFANVKYVVYPNQRKYLDMADLMPRIKNWLDTTPQSMGNWTSKETVLKGVNYVCPPVPIFEGKFPFDEVNRLLKENRGITVIGFDVLQIPVAAARFGLGE